MNKLKIFVISIIMLLARTSMAQMIKVSEPGLDEAAANAINPGAFVTKLQMQPTFTWKDKKARQLLMNMRIIQPSGSIGLPFIKSKNPAKVYTIYRLELPLVGQTFPSKPVLDATGLADVTILDLITFKNNWGLWGFGPNLLIPTIHPISISGGKWCAGLTGFVVNTQTKGLIFGFSAQQFYSFAGDVNKPNRNFMIFQPIISKILGGGFFISSNMNIILDWAKNEYSVPLIFQFGRAFARNLSAYIAPQYMLTGPGKGDITLQFQLNAMIPPLKK